MAIINKYRVIGGDIPADLFIALPVTEVGILSEIALDQLSQCTIEIGVLKGAVGNDMFASNVGSMSYNTGIDTTGKTIWITNLSGYARKISCYARWTETI